MLKVNSKKKKFFIDDKRIKKSKIEFNKLKSNYLSKKTMAHNKTKEFVKDVILIDLERIVSEKTTNKELIDDANDFVSTLYEFIDGIIVELVLARLKEIIKQRGKNWDKNIK